MIAILSQNWWTLLLRGLVAILFGIIAFAYPSAAIIAGLAVFAAFAFIEGIFAFMAAFGWGLPSRERWLMGLLGLLGIAIGVLAVVRPGITALSIVLLVAWWAIIGGIIQIVVAVEMRKQIPGEWWLVLSGLLSIAFGALLFWRPGVGLVTLVWIFASYAIAYGVIMLLLAFRARSLTTSAAR